ncbi:MAG: HAMP domain-containing protein, partial [Treponema sp.]|nr:HAMP domain-containing protein [Treponema sp.]
MSHKFFRSFSARLSLRFMFIMTGAVVLLSVFFLFFIRSLVFTSQEEELKNAEKIVYAKLEERRLETSSAPKFGGTLGAIPELPYYISYIIYDVDDLLLLATNDPFLPYLPDTRGKAKRYFEKDYFFDGDLNILYCASQHSETEHTVIAAVVLNLDNNFTLEIFRKLPLAFLFLSIPILILSFLVSLFMTRRTIRPVVKITKAAQSVTIENLSDLLPLSGFDDEIDELSKTFNALFLQ